MVETKELVGPGLRGRQAGTKGQEGRDYEAGRARTKGQVGGN